MVRKCGDTAAVAVMDAAAAGVRTRGRPSTTATSAGGAKRRRTGQSNSELLKPRSNNSTCTQLRSSVIRCNSATPPPVTVSVTESFCCLSTSSEDQASVSCCSSYGSSEVEKDRLRFTDLEEECSEANSSASLFRKERWEKTPSSEVGGEEETDSMNSSAAKAVEPIPPQRSQEESQSSVDADPEELFGKTRKPEIKRPSNFEIEEFFAAAEAENLLELERFKNKYNFDFVKEEPLKGRFEWHQISPVEQVAKKIQKRPQDG